MYPDGYYYGSLTYRRDLMSQELRESEKRLRDLCRRYALAVCNGEMMFYDPDGDGTYLGVRIMLAGGGPNVYLDTYHEMIQGLWGGDSCKLVISDFEYIDDYWEEMYGCLK